MGPARRGASPQNPPVILSTSGRQRGLPFKSTMDLYLNLTWLIRRQELLSVSDLLGV